MDDANIQFIDLPEEWFPITIKFTDMETNEVIREFQLEGPGVLSDGGFGKGKWVRMDLKLGNGEEQVVITDGRRI